MRNAPAQLLKEHWQLQRKLQLQQGLGLPLDPVCTGMHTSWKRGTQQMCVYFSRHMPCHHSPDRHAFGPLMLAYKQQGLQRPPF
jgi:hypothetical protein